jgi:hypothetical protein
VNRFRLTLAEIPEGNSDKNPFSREITDIGHRPGWKLSVAFPNHE